MKKTKILLISILALANAALFSLGVACLLGLLGIAFAVALDGSAVIAQYPRYIPFCLMLGILALIGLVGIWFASIKMSGKFHFTKKTWCFQYVGALVLSVPMIKIWEAVFHFLRETL